LHRIFSTQQKIIPGKKKKVQGISFSIIKDTISEKESYRAIAVFNKSLIILSIGIGQYKLSINSQKNKN